jgi:uncharacterized membrane protein YecN with MAPEG domain
MSVLHSVLAWSAVAGAACFIAASLAAALGRAGSWLWLDRAILIQGGTAVAASVAGVLALAIGGRPPEPLHLMYGAILVGGPVATRYALRDAPIRRVGKIMTIIALIVAGVLLRSFMTGD